MVDHARGAPSLIAALLLSLAVTLTGCVGGTAPAPAPASTSMPTPSAVAEPVDTPTTVTTLVARADVLELHDASGAIVGRFDYADSPDEAIDALTVVFGRAPDSEHRDAVSMHTPPRVLHTWGALTLEERLYPAEIREKQEASGLTMPAFLVSFAGPNAGGIRLTTAPGISAGDALDAIDVPRDPADQSCVGPAIDQVDARSTENPELRVGVVLSDFVVDEANQTTTPVDYVARVIAPVPVGPGCV